MLPVVTSDIREALEQALEDAKDEWKRQLVHHIREDNPEINTLLLNLAQNSNDAKKVILAGYLVYKALEIADEQDAI